MPAPISVITINYNNLAGLKRTFYSVQNQTARQQIEFVVVDGGSRDGSAEFLQQHAAEIDTLVIEKDNGIYDAMNKGLQRSTGKYVWFVNSGDSIYRETVGEGLLKLTQSDPGVIFGDTMFIDEDGTELGLISKMKPQPLPVTLGPGSFRFGMNVCHQSFLARRDLCEPYNLTYRQAADIDWIIRILKKKPVSVRADFIVSCFETGGSSALNEKKALKERYKVLAAHYGALTNVFAHVWIILRRALFRIGIWKP